LAARVADAGKTSIVEKLKTGRPVNLPTNLPADPVLSYQPESLIDPTRVARAMASGGSSDENRALSGALSHWTIQRGQGAQSASPSTGGLNPRYFEAETPRPGLKESFGQFLPTSSEARGIPSPDFRSEQDAPTVRRRAPGEPDEKGGTSAAGPTYELVRCVGRGGCGEVWAARQHSLGRTVAVKKIRYDTIGGDPSNRSAIKTVEREFRMEAALTALLEHPNIVPVHDLGADETGSPLLAMKLVRGAPWDKLLRSDRGVLSPDEFLAKHLAILVDMAQAVAFAHDRGIIHRDLKPAQVMTGAFGETLLMDWGLALCYGQARRAPEAEEADGEPARNVAGLPTVETATNPAGTPALMAPEQTRETAEGIGPWTDIYLLGGTLYYILAGSYPHSANSSLDAMKRAMIGDIEPPSLRSPNEAVPPDLEAVCLRALAADPRARHLTAGDFLKDIQDYLSGASNRRESDALVDKAEELLLRKRLGYKELAECDNALVRSQGLWAGNPRVGGALERACERYAVVALQNNDLVLALAQADRMQAGPKRLALMGQIHDRQKMMGRLKKQRQALAGVAVVLFVAALVAAYVAMWKADEAVAALDVARAARDRAQNARDGAHEIVGVLLTDLVDLLAPIGKLEPIDAACEAAIRYFESLTEEELSGVGRLRGKALFSMSVVNEKKGDSAKAIANVEVSVEAYKGAWRKDAKNAALLSEYAEACGRLASLRQKAGDVEGSRVALAEMMGALAVFASSGSSRGGTTLDAVEVSKAIAGEPGAANVSVASLLYAYKALDELAPRASAMGIDNLTLGNGYLIVAQSIYEQKTEFATARAAADKAGYVGEYEARQVSSDGTKEEQLVAIEGVTLAIEARTLQARIMMARKEPSSDVVSLLEATERMATAIRIRGESERGELGDARTRYIMGYFFYVCADIHNELGNAEKRSEFGVKAFGFAAKLAVEDPNNAQYRTLRDDILRKGYATMADSGRGPGGPGMGGPGMGGPPSGPGGQGGPPGQFGPRGTPPPHPPDSPYWRQNQQGGQGAEGQGQQPPPQGEQGQGGPQGQGGQGQGGYAPPGGQGQGGPPPGMTPPPRPTPPPHPQGGRPGQRPPPRRDR
jgi:serine/threonine protein kinase